VEILISEIIFLFQMIGPFSSLFMDWLFCFVAFENYETVVQKNVLFLTEYMGHGLLAKP